MNTRTVSRLVVTLVVTLVALFGIVGSAATSGATSVKKVPAVWSKLPTLSSVESLLNRAIAIHTLPKQTIPQLGDAWSGPNTSELDGQSNCGAVNGSPVDISSETPCIFGARTGKHTLVVVGDSEADSWTPALDVWGKGAGWKIVRLVKYGCEPWVDNSDSGWKNCIEFRAFEVKTIKRLRPNVVFVDGMAVNNQSGIVPINVKSESSAIEGFAREIASVHALVLVPQNIPWLYKYLAPETCLSRSAANEKPCQQIPRSKAIDQSMLLAIATAAKSHLIDELDTDELFCTSTVCPELVGNHIVMADQHHMASTWGSYIARALDQVLEPVLTKNHL
jgi:hypothetical protein